MPDVDLLALFAGDDVDDVGILALQAMTDVEGVKGKVVLEVKPVGSMAADVAVGVARKEAG